MQGTIQLFTEGELPKDPKHGRLSFVDGVFYIFDFNSGWQAYERKVFLDSGKPAYQRGRRLVSIESLSVKFDLKTNGSRNTYLNYIDTLASNTAGFYLPDKMVLTQISMSIGNALNVSADFQVRRSSSGSLLSSGTISEGLKNAVEYKDTDFGDGESVAVYLSCSKNVVNPICVLTFNWRD